MNILFLNLLFDEEKKMVDMIDNDLLLEVVMMVYYNNLNLSLDASSTLVGIEYYYLLIRRTFLIKIKKHLIDKSRKDDNIANAVFASELKKNSLF
jgi:hypothetical protein